MTDPEVDTLQAGEVVTVFEEVECDGHVRCRISESAAGAGARARAGAGTDRWISRVTASGKVLAGLSVKQVTTQLEQWFRGRGPY